MLFFFHGANNHEGPLEHVRANLKGRVHLIASFPSQFKLLTSATQSAGQRPFLV